MLSESMLRYAVPELYNKMIEIFADYHIHPYDVQANVSKDEDGYEISLHFAADFSQTLKKQFSFEQVKTLDEEVIHFFQEAANQCKSVLIANYYKMMKL